MSNWLVDINQRQGDRHNFSNATFSLNDATIDTHFIRVFRMTQEDGSSFVGDISLDVRGSCLDPNRPPYTVISVLISAVVGTLIGLMLVYFYVRRKASKTNIVSST